MAKAIIQGKPHPVRVHPIMEGNYGVSVLSAEGADRATIDGRPATLFRYKLNAKSPEGALRTALKALKDAGSISDYELEPHEQPPVEEEAPAKAAAADKPAAAAGEKPAKKPLSPEEKEALRKAALEKKAAKAAAAAESKPANAEADTSAPAPEKAKPEAEPKVPPAGSEPSEG